MLFALNMIPSAGCAVINKLKVTLKSNTVALLTAGSSVRAVRSGGHRFGRLPDLLEGMAVAGSIPGALRNSFCGAIKPLSGFVVSAPTPAVLAVLGTLGQKRVQVCWS